MDGLIVIDKPAGPTSHDVVARMRRVLRERRIGHTGTLDPLATGVLPLVIGRATRLARFLSGSEKCYDAVVRLGFATDTGDSEGKPLKPPHTGPLPTQVVVEEALGSFRGQFLQTPPEFSAKKVAGRRSYHIARSASKSAAGKNHFRSASDVLPKLIAPVSVTVSRLDLTALAEDRVSLTLTCSAGFYVRALARDLGERLGVGAHLVALRRTRAGQLTLDEAIPLEAAERDPSSAAARIVPLSGMLTHLPALTLNADQTRRAIQGRDVPAGLGIRDSGLVRLVDQEGDLIAIAEPASSAVDFLHPSVVLR